MASSQSVLLHETIDGVRVLRLNRPDKMNGIDAELCKALIEAVADATRDADVRVVGITGEGKGFCAGADLGGSKASEFKRDELDDLGFVGRLALVIRVECDKPVIAGINGLAVGGGVALAMLADMRIASSAATFNPGYTRVGLSPDAGLSWMLPNAVGHEQAMRFLLELQTIDAQAALKMGMVGEVVDAEEFEHAFMGYCKKIASAAPLALRHTKRLISQAGLSTDLASHLRDENHFIDRGIKSEDAQEAIRALFKKRKPEFKGE